MLQLKIVHRKEKWGKDISKYFKGKEIQTALKHKNMLNFTYIKINGK